LATIEFCVSAYFYGKGKGGIAKRDPPGVDIQPKISKVHLANC
jgi:hypothetical protein